MYGDKIGNRGDSTNEMIMEHESNKPTPKVTSLIEKIHDSLLRENSKIQSMHSNILSLETRVKGL